MIDTITGNLKRKGIGFEVVPQWGSNGETAILPEFGMSDLQHLGIDPLEGADSSSGTGWCDWYSEGVIIIGV